MKKTLLALLLLSLTLTGCVVDPFGGNRQRGEFHRDRDHNDNWADRGDHHSDRDRNGDWNR
jgi:hypothetical protein